VRTCCIHLPSNVECPYVALYVVRWRHNSPDNYRPEAKPPQVMIRYVCTFHLADGINYAIADSARGDHPEVTLAELV